jgi:cobalt-zinc-cadmium efflux system membrane fusion protein
MIFVSLQRSLRRSRLYVGCLILTPALLLSGCKAKQDKPAEAAQQRNAAEVSVTPALAENLKFGTPQMTDVHGTLQVAARVETNARQIAHVGSPVAGSILKILAFEGQ